MSQGMRWTQEDYANHLRKLSKPKGVMPSDPPNSLAGISVNGGVTHPPTNTSYRKYRAQRTQVGDTWFDSKREAARYQQLHVMLKAGAIADLETQPRFELIASNGEICGWDHK